MTGVCGIPSLLRRTFSLKQWPSRSFLHNGGGLFSFRQQQILAEKKRLKAAFSISHGHKISYKPDSIKVDENGQICNIKWSDGLYTEFHSIWLRHNCHCSQCRHENGQKLMIPSKISSNTRIQDMCIEGNSLNIIWSSEEDHKGILPLKYIRDHNYNEETILRKRQTVKPVNPVHIPTVTYKGITNSIEEYVKWIQQITEDGFSIVQNVPQEENMVKMVGELIAPVWTSIYGDVFDVISLPNPKNIAYSSHELDLHMDLVYFQSPPGFQLLHCLKFDECVQGGVGIFVDVFTVAEEFRSDFPDLFHTLTTLPATFQKVHFDRELPVHIVYQRPHINLNHKGDDVLNNDLSILKCDPTEDVRISYYHSIPVDKLDEIRNNHQLTGVFWAPGFEGAVSLSGKDVESYYRAYEMFAKAIRHSPHILKHRLQPGELVIFNNLRILHGRTEFHLNGGSRHFQGCYLNIDMVKSQAQVTNILHGDGRLVKRVGNEDWC